jgi:predicted signal transduction protein with EAL and GGDEF domain
VKLVEAPAGRSDSFVTQLFFIAGGILVVIGLTFAVAHHWPSLDPLALIALVGIGLLLIVACERLSLILRELRRISSLLHAACGSAEDG